jgi:hypothetical protein
LIADRLGNLIDPLLGGPLQLDAARAWLALLGYAFQICLCHTEIGLSATLEGEPLGRVEVKALFKLATYVLARRALSGELTLFDHLFTYFK